MKSWPFEQLCQKVTSIEVAYWSFKRTKDSNSHDTTLHTSIHFGFFSELLAMNVTMRQRTQDCCVGVWLGRTECVSSLYRQLSTRSSKWSWRRGEPVRNNLFKRNGLLSQHNQSTFEKPIFTAAIYSSCAFQMKDKDLQLPSLSHKEIQNESFFQQNYLIVGLKWINGHWIAPKG